MIIEPDFVDHWKTRLLVGLLGDDELAPIYLIRLWAHCQQRKSSSFVSLPTAGIKAICRYQGAAPTLEEALIGSGFAARDGAALQVLGWDEYNASLIANWANGSKGGRPKNNPPITHGLAMGKPSETHGTPDREDKSREDKKTTTTSSSGDDVRQCPAGTLVNLYHELMPSNPRVKVLSKARKSAIRSRWLEAASLDCKPFGYASKEAGLEAWRQFFEICAESKFLTGLSPPQNGKPSFIADIDFIFSPSGFAKTLENKYHRDAI